MKKQQCKKATRVCKLNSFSDKIQRWKLDDYNKLKNKEGIWKSDDLWRFIPKLNFFDEPTDYIYIENTSKKVRLRATRDGKVNQVVFENDTLGYLWKKGLADAEGYFTLIESENHSPSGKVITATSESDLEIKGNFDL